MQIILVYVELLALTHFYVFAAAIDFDDCIVGFAVLIT